MVLMAKTEKPVDVDAMVRNVLGPLMAQDQAAAEALTLNLQAIAESLGAIRTALLEEHQNLVWLIRRLVLSNVLIVDAKERAALGIPVSTEALIEAGVKRKAAEIRAAASQKAG